MDRGEAEARAAAGRSPSPPPASLLNLPFYTCPSILALLYLPFSLLGSLALNSHVHSFSPFRRLFREAQIDRAEKHRGEAKALVDRSQAAPNAPKCPPLAPLASLTPSKQN